MVNLVSQ